MLIEARPRLGGRTASFRRGGLEVDTGQHVFMRCCTAYLGLLDRLGTRSDVRLQPRLDIPVVAPGRPRPARIYRTRGPAPLHLLAALSRYSLLSPRRRIAMARAVVALRRVDPGDPRTDEQSFGNWLGAHGQDRQAIEAIWDLVNVATLNAPSDRSSLALAATVFQVGLLTDPRAADLGWARVPLGRLHGQAALERLQDSGVEVRTAKALAVSPDGQAWTVRLAEGDPAAGSLSAEAVVVAVPPAAAERILPPGAGLSPGWSSHLTDAPIVNVHLVYDRVVMEQPLLAAIGSPVQWVFDRTEPSALTSGQYLAVSLSAAADLAILPTRVICERIVSALAELLPAARNARLLDRFATREPAATFLPAPGTAAWRHATRTALPGLYLAGAWTDTGWPDTMEGAVRSGQAAATAAVQELGAPALTRGSRRFGATPSPLPGVSA